LLDGPGLTDHAAVLVGVRKSYPAADGGAVLVLDDFDLEVPTASRVAITGPSGTGKTTILHLIAGLELASAGQVVVFGTPMSALSEGERTRLRAHRVGMVFQDPRLLPGLSALENVAIPAIPWRHRRASIEAEAGELLRAVGLEQRAQFNVARLSGGERQRVAIARALMGGKPLLLLDEPTGNLDAATTAEFVALVDRLQRTRGLTVVVATHDAAVAALGDMVVELPGKSGPVR
jgi:putative ABC transport system ATP-binding protein